MGWWGGRRWASPVVAESAPVPNADPTPAETMLMNQTVEQYMASLVSKLHLDADPSGLAHTLESELGITSMEELQDAAEQLPYVLDDSFPREILEELIPKPTFEVVRDSPVYPCRCAKKTSLPTLTPSAV